jgi:5-methylcytosine-specific restriction endonuclease McrBC regulatory subunit McrC
VNNSEVLPKRLRIVLSEYGNPIEQKHLKTDEGEVTALKGGIVLRGTIDQHNLCWNTEDEELAETLKSVTGIEIDALRNGNLRIKANSHVGHVAFSTFDLVILPKFDHLVDTQESPLLTLLAYAFNLDNLKIVGTQISPAAYFAEILIHWFLKEVHNIQRRGLCQQYLRERRDLSVIRGKIDLKTWLRRGGIPSERMPCVFHRRSLDNILNQTLCAGLRRSVAIASSDSLKSECRYLADNFVLDGVSDRSLDYRMLADARRGLNRLNAHYEKAVQIVRMLYEGSGGFVLGDPHREQVRIPGFFFDMNDLFERVVGRFLQENLPSAYKVRLQTKRGGFFYGGRVRIINPDIIVLKTIGAEQYVLDTKYKDIGQGIPQNADLYQLSVYALSCSRYQNTPKRRARIVYPADSNAEERRIDLRQGKHSDDLCSITLHPVNLIGLAGMIDKGDKERRERYALKIIGERTGNNNGATPE